MRVTKEGLRISAVAAVALMLAAGLAAVAPGGASAQSASAPACERPHPPSQC